MTETELEMTSGYDLNEVKVQINMTHRISHSAST